MTVFTKASAYCTDDGAQLKVLDGETIRVYSREQSKAFVITADEATAISSGN